jgi:hypothetical protein
MTSLILGQRLKLIEIDVAERTDAQVILVEFVSKIPSRKLDMSIDLLPHRYRVSALTPFGPPRPQSYTATDQEEALIQVHLDDSDIDGGCRISLNLQLVHSYDGE